MDGLAGKAAVITGAASGIGFAAVELMAAVAPGAVLTPTLRVNLPTEALGAIRRHTSFGQLGEPADIAHRSAP